MVQSDIKLKEKIKKNQTTLIDENKMTNKNKSKHKQNLWCAESEIC